MILDNIKCQKKCFRRVLSSWWPVLALLKSQNALKMVYLGGKKKGQKEVKNGSKMGQKWVKNGSKMCFSKKDPRPFGVHKQVK